MAKKYGKKKKKQVNIIEDDGLTEAEVVVTPEEPQTSRAETATTAEIETENITEKDEVVMDEEIEIEQAPTEDVQTHRFDTGFFGGEEDDVPQEEPEQEPEVEKISKEDEDTIAEQLKETKENSDPEWIEDQNQEDKADSGESESKAEAEIDEEERYKKERIRKGKFPAKQLKKRKAKILPSKGHCDSGRLA